MRIFDAQWIDEIVRQTKVYLSPTKSNVHFRYLKTKPLLLPYIKNAAIGGIIKEKLGVIVTPSTDGRE